MEISVLRTWSYSFWYLVSCYNCVSCHAPSIANYNWIHSETGNTISISSSKLDWNWKLNLFVYVLFWKKYVWW